MLYSCQGNGSSNSDANSRALASPLGNAKYIEFIMPGIARSFVVTAIPPGAMRLLTAPSRRRENLSLPTVSDCCSISFPFLSVGELNQYVSMTRLAQRTPASQVLSSQLVKVVSNLTHCNVFVIPTCKLFDWKPFDNVV